MDPSPRASPFAHVGASLDDEQLREKLWAIFVESLGGPDVLHWLVLHFEEGWSYRQIAELARAANESTVRSRMKKAVHLLNRHELLPPHWADPRSRRSHAPKRRKIRGLEGMGLPEMAPDSGEERYSVMRAAPTPRAKNLAQPRSSYRGGLRRWINRLLNPDPAPPRPPAEETTMRDWTDITLVLDRSGSMGAVRDETIGSFNRFLHDQQAAGDNASLTLVQFNDADETVYDAIPLPEAPPLSRATFKPRGSTALLDAMGRTIDRTGRRLAAMPAGDRPERVLVVVLTDGMENASRAFTRDRVFAQIAHQRDMYGWRFVFLGANQDAIATAASYGIDAGSSLNFAATPEGIERALSKLSAGTVRFRVVRRGQASKNYFD